METDASDTDVEETGVETDEPTEDTGMVQYFADEIHSPVTSEMAELWREWLGSNDALKENVFMKVGASSTASSRTLYCFAGDDVMLDEYDDLEHTLEHYLAGDAAGATSFDRVTLAAKSGRTARWVLSGDPSPIEQEYDALLPSAALIHYGTNDMGMGSTYASAMPDFYDAMMSLMDLLLERGVLPILTGISHRGDRASADAWVPTYNTLIRGMAQGRKVPFLDLYAAMDPLVDHGLSSDGIHLNKGPYGVCDFTEEALEYGYNMRNLIALQSLDRVKKVLVDDAQGLDDQVTRLRGRGVNDDPFLISKLPFADFRNTLDAVQSVFDVYTCDDADESGPEFVYQLTLEEETPLRVMVMDRNSTDIDIHILDSEMSCLARGHRTIEMTLEPGDYFISADTWVDDQGVEQAGAYQLIVVECAEGDVACQ